MGKVGRQGADVYRLCEAGEGERIGAAESAAESGDEMT